MLPRVEPGRALAAMVWATAACTPERAVGPSSGAVARSAEPETDRDPEPDAVVLAWKHVDFARAAMELELVDAPHETRDWPRGGVLIQTIDLGEGEALRVLVRAGEGESLAAFAEEHDDEGARFSRKKVHACGGWASRLEVHEPGRDIACIEYSDGRPSSPGYDPPTTSVAVHFRHHGLDVVASWGISTALRERHRADEERFFASLACR